MRKAGRVGLTSPPWTRFCLFMKRQQSEQRRKPTIQNFAAVFKELRTRMFILSGREGISHVSGSLLQKHHMVDLLDADAEMVKSVED